MNRCRAILVAALILGAAWRADAFVLSVASRAAGDEYEAMGAPEHTVPAVEGTKPGSIRITADRNIDLMIESVELSETGLGALMRDELLLETPLAAGACVEIAARPSDGPPRYRITATDPSDLTTAVWTAQSDELFGRNAWKIFSTADGGRDDIVQAMTATVSSLEARGLLAPSGWIRESEIERTMPQGDRFTVVTRTDTQMVLQFARGDDGSVSVRRYKSLSVPPVFASLGLMSGMSHTMLIALLGKPGEQHEERLTYYDRFTGAEWAAFIFTNDKLTGLELNGVIDGPEDRSPEEEAEFRIAPSSEELLSVRIEMDTVPLSIASSDVTVRIPTLNAVLSPDHAAKFPRLAHSLAEFNRELVEHVAELALELYSRREDLFLGDSPCAIDDIVIDRADGRFVSLRAHFVTLDATGAIWDTKSSVFDTDTGSRLGFDDIVADEDVLLQTVSAALTEETCADSTTSSETHEPSIRTMPLSLTSDGARFILQRPPDRELEIDVPFSSCPDAFTKNIRR